jgi:hypothetical protein
MRPAGHTADQSVLHRIDVALRAPVRLRGADGEGPQGEGVSRTGDRGDGGWAEGARGEGRVNFRAWKINCEGNLARAADALSINGSALLLVLLSRWSYARKNGEGVSYLKSNHSDQRIGSEMDEIFDVTSFTARRKSTGAVFEMNTTPPEFAAYDCKYTNSALSVEVTFSAKWIYEQNVIELRGRSFQVEVCTGVILIEEELENALTRSLQGRADSVDVNTVTRDCYELISVFIRKTAFQKYSINILPRIYETSAWRLQPFFRPNSVEVGLEAVHGSQAKQIF